MWPWVLDYTFLNDYFDNISSLISSRLSRLQALLKMKIVEDKIIDQLNLSIIVCNNFQLE